MCLRCHRAGSLRNSQYIEKCVNVHRLGEDRLWTVTLWAPLQHLMQGHHRRFAFKITTLLPFEGSSASMDANGTGDDDILDSLWAPTFWGVEVKPGKTTPFVPPPFDANLHISQVLVCLTRKTTQFQGQKSKLLGSLVQVSSVGHG